MENYAVSRTTDTLDVFRVDDHGVLKTASYSAMTGNWSEWLIIPGAVFPARQSVCSVSSSPDDVYLFIVDENSRIQSYCRSSLQAAGTWQGPVQIDGIAVSSASIHAVSRSSGNVTLFASEYAAGGDHTLYHPASVVLTASSNGTFGTPDSWTAWSAVAGGQVVTSNAGQFSTVISDPSTVDLFAFDYFGIVHSRWSDTTAQWTAWQKICGVSNDAPFAVSRSVTQIDVVTMVEWTPVVASWDTSSQPDDWHGWFDGDYYAGLVLTFQPVFAVALDADSLLIFGRSLVNELSGLYYNKLTFSSVTGAEPIWGSWAIVPGDIGDKYASLCVVRRGDHMIHFFADKDDGMMAASLDLSSTEYKFTEWSHIAADLIWPINRKIPIQQTRKIPDIIQNIPRKRMTRYIKKPIR